jgi:ADP-ribose pyrophosphatase YjhB (NUDIX family)
MLVKESLLNEEEKVVELSAGLAIIQNNTILLGHPTNQKWQGTFSIPKGRVEEGEDLLDTAIRETREEIGITIDPSDIEDTEPQYIDYKDKKGVTYKRVYYFIVKPKIEIKSTAITPDKKEIDWAGFLLKDAANQRIFWRLKDILKNMEEKTENKEGEAGENKEETNTEPELGL